MVEIGVAMVMLLAMKIIMMVLITTMTAMDGCRGPSLDKMAVVVWGGHVRR